MGRPLYSIDAKGMIHARETTPAEDRALSIHMARVFLAEAMRRRLDRGFAATLLDWAAKRRRAAAAIDLSPAQGDFFTAAQWSGTAQETTQ